MVARDAFAQRVSNEEQRVLAMSPPSAVGEEMGGTGRCPECGSELRITPRRTAHAIPACARWARHMEDWQWLFGDTSGKPFDLNVPTIARAASENSD